MTKNDQLKRHDMCCHQDQYRTRKRTRQELTKENEDKEHCSDAFITNDTPHKTNAPTEYLQEKQILLNDENSNDIATNLIDAVVASQKSKLHYPS